MKKILIAVDDSKGAEQAVKILAGWSGVIQPESILILHVQKLFGRSIMGEVLESDQDLNEISAALEGSEYTEKLDAASNKIVNYYNVLLEKAGFQNINTLVKKGHPAEQIINTAKEEGVDLIVIGPRGRRLHTLLLGSVSREVVNTSPVSVLIAH